MGKFVDITGQQFGEWQVLKYLGSSKWLCRCSCDNEKAVAGKSLKSGASKSCGHDTSVLKDIAGQQFGRWRVVEYVADGKWLCECQCKDKTLSLISGTALRSDHSTNCGCVRKEKMAKRNSESREHLEGRTFGDWEVLEYVGDKHYKCRCSCGRIKEVASRDLKDGISKSCGHNNSRDKIIDITEQRFGSLVVKKYLGYGVWECKCDCGNTTNVLKHNLHNNSVKSCGCNQYNNISKDEILSVIEDYIAKNNRKPLLDELADKFKRHPGHMRRYINKYELAGYINKEFSSKGERDIYQLCENAVLHDRTILEGQELDIYIPDKSIAIEFNGDYWHSDLLKNKEYHQIKSLKCIKQGIQLLHVYEYEWEKEESRHKIKRLIQQSLSNKQSIDTTNAELKFINDDEAKAFIDKNSLYSNLGTKHLGIHLDNNLIGLMTFNTEANTINIEQIKCTDELSINDATFKFIEYFNDEYNIQVKLNLDKQNTRDFTQNGFKILKINNPEYVWVDVYTKDIVNDEEILNGMSAEDINKLGIYKIYDAGSIILERKIGGQ